MNAATLLPKLKIRFEAYVRRFASDDPMVRKNTDLKTEHTFRVCEVIREIGSSVDLGEEDRSIAEASGLLHDIGRFEQYRKYRTFADHKSEDHAALGVRIIRAERILDGLDPEPADMILRAVEHHNRIGLPEGAEARFLLILKMLRDADKVDIWRVVTQYYRESEHKRNETVELDLPDTGRVSDPVLDALMNGKPVRMADLRTLTDFKLLQIGWIYDINFKRAFEMVLEKKYLEAVRDALPRETAGGAEIYNRARAYLMQRVRH